MNSDWQNFISERKGVIDDKLGVTFPQQAYQNQDKVIYPLNHLGAISVTGLDAATFLQGQITCNVNDTGPSQSKLAAICNPKGRVIATFLLVNTGESFLLILPLELADTVQKKLQMYVLRSDVKISNASEDYGFLGICNERLSGRPFDTEIHDEIIAISLPGKISRKLLVAPVDKMIAYWRECVLEEDFHESGTASWRLLDLMAGIPWLSPETSEEFIPQMLNLDMLGGISFTKGCYTGQEIVARTHYLGKNKRQMVLAECELPEAPAPNSAVIYNNDPERQAAGHVLAAQRDESGCKLQVILPAAGTAQAGFSLRDYPDIPLRFIPFQYD